MLDDVQRIPAIHLHRTAGRVAIEVDASFMEGLAQDEPPGCAVACERHQLQDAIAQDQEGPAAPRHLNQQLQVGLAVLDDALPLQRVQRGRLHAEPQVGYQLARQVLEGLLDVGAHGLALAQAVEQVVAAHVDLTLVGRAVNELHPGHLAHKQRLAPACQGDPQALAGAQPVGHVQRPGRVAEGQLALGRDRKAQRYDHLLQGSQSLSLDGISIDFDDDLGQLKTGFHGCFFPVIKGGMRSTRPGRRWSGSRMRLKIAMIRHSAGSL